MTSILSPEDLKTLEKNGLLKPSKRTPTKTRRQKRKNPSTPTKETQPTEKPVEEKPKRETFKTTILRLLKEKGKPLKREQLVKKAIKENPPKSSKPQWVYHDIIRKLRKDDQVFISNHRRKEQQMVSLEPILKEEQRKK